MHVYVDSGADVNLMPHDMYIKLFNDDKLKHLKPSDIKLGVWGDDQIALLGKCNIYLVHPDTKKPVEVTFYVTDKSGSTLLSCATSLKLDLIKLHPRLGVPPPRAKIITSQASWTSPAAKRVTQGKVMFDEMKTTVQELSVIGKWARYQNDQHDKMSSMVPRSAPYDHHIWPPFKPLMAPFSLLQPHTAAPFRGVLSVVERWARYHNDQDSELSSLVPRSASYDCPIQAPFKPLMAPFKIPLQPLMAPFKGEPVAIQKPDKYQNHQHDKASAVVPESAPYGPHSSPLWPHLKSPYSLLWPHSEEITSPYSITRYTKMFSSTSREKCTLWDLLSTANSPTNSTANNMFRVYVYWKIQKQ